MSTPAFQPVAVGQSYPTASLAAQAQAMTAFRAAQDFLMLMLLRDVLKVWGGLNLQDVRSSWPALRIAIAALVRERFGLSVAQAQAYYAEARKAAGILGSFPAPRVPLPSPELIGATLDSTGPYALLGRIKKAQPVPTAMQNTGVILSGAASRLVLNGARQVILQSVKDDAEALGWMRVTAANPCSWCAMLASRGVAFRSAESAGFKAHNMCVPAGTLSQGPSVEAAYRRWYEGELVIVSTSAGKELSITPNHPVLTTEGWVPAGLLHEGHDVIGSLDGNWSAPDRPDEYQRPALIENVWRALSMVSLVRMPVSAEDFHGDGTDGEVQVVSANGLLPDEFGELSAEPGVERVLVTAAMRGGSLAALRDSLNVLNGAGLAANRVMGRLGEAGALSRGETGHAQVHRVAQATWPDSGPEQRAPDRRTGYSEAPGQGLLGLATLVEGNDLRLWARDGIPSGLDPALGQLAHKDTRRESGIGGGHRTGCPRDVGDHGLIELGAVHPVRTRRFDPGLLDGLMEGGDGYASLGAGLRQRLAGCVETDRIVNLRRVDFAGHVFNLQTAEGWYEANGIVVSNCRCTAQPVYSHRDAEALTDNPLRQQWDQVTAGLSGKDALNAWRRWWNKEHPDALGSHLAA